MRVDDLSVTVLIADDQTLFREGLREVLARFPDIAVVGEASDGQEAVRLAGRLAPDVVLMDIRMPLLDGVAATRRMREASPGSKVIMLTTFDDDELVYGGLRAGAAGYLLKDVSSAVLADAIRATARGESFLHPAVAAKVVTEFSRMAERSAALPVSGVDPISHRELEILAIMSTGATNREIANALFIAEGTVKNHITSILAKLGVKDRSQAVAKARDLGLI